METLLSSLPQGLGLALGALVRTALFSYWPSRIGTPPNKALALAQKDCGPGYKKPPYHTQGHQRHEGAACTDANTSLLLENFSQAVTQSSMVSTRISSGMSEC